MSRHGDSIFKRKDGRWEARYLVERKADGKAVYRSIYAKTYRDVREKRDLAIQMGEITQKKNETLNFSYILEQWLICNEGRLKKQTVVKYRYCMEKHILPELGMVPMEKLCPDMINQFYQQKLTHGGKDGQELSGNYVRIMSIILSSALKFAVNQGWCEPLRGQILKPKTENKKAAVMQRKEQLQLEHTLGPYPTGAALAVYLSLYAGLRIGEVCALKWSDIDFDEKLLYVNGTVVRINEDHHTLLKIDVPKSNTSRRVIPLTEQLCTVLEKEQKRSFSSYVVAKENQKDFMNPRTLENNYKNLLRQSGLDSMPYHTLRHTFATRCMECGVDTKSLSEMLGHSKVNITLDIYVHSSLEVKRNAIRRLKDISGQNSGMNG